MTRGSVNPLPKKVGKFLVRLGYVASQPQYAEHLRPIWEASPGPFGIHPSGEADRWLVASSADLRQVVDVYMEHGVGLAWHKPDILRMIAKATVLAPNDFIADRYRQEGIAATVVGTPKLDGYLALPSGAAVAVGFHWTSAVYSRVMQDYEQPIRDLASQVEVIGHGHPRAWRKLEPFWRHLGIEAVPDFRDVVSRSRLWVCDHSSTLYEYAALDRGVVLLKGMGNRPFESTGLRYTSFSGIGPHADPRNLVDTVLEALGAPEKHAGFRQEATTELFPYLGRSVRRVLDVLGVRRPDRDRHAGVGVSDGVADGRGVLGP